jgi:hypothetical protein
MMRLPHTSRVRALAALVATLVTVAAAAAKGHTVITYNVTSTVFDSDSFGNATLVQGDDPMFGSAVYVAGTSGVVSQLDTNGGTDWNLDLRASSRGIYLTLLTPAGAPVPGLPANAVFDAGRLVSRCFAPTGGTAAYEWFNITDDPNCAMRVNFSVGSTSYTLVMSPLYPGTGLASVHCNAFSGSNCVDWAIAPNPNVPNAGLANLYSIAKNGSEKYVAACRLTFRIHVTYL